MAQTHSHLALGDCLDFRVLVETLELGFVMNKLLGYRQLRNQFPPLDLVDLSISIFKDCIHLLVLSPLVEQGRVIKYVYWWWIYDVYSLGSLSRSEDISFLSESSLRQRPLSSASVCIR